MHMPPGLSHSDRHPHREHHDSQSLKHRPLPKLFKTAAVIDGLRLRRLSVAVLFVETPRQTDAATAVPPVTKAGGP